MNSEAVVPSRGLPSFHERRGESVKTICGLKTQGDLKPLRSVAIADR
jgi:hypothetical protein